MSASTAATHVLTNIHGGTVNTTPGIRNDASLAGSVWRLDPNASRAEFRARTYWGLVTVRGRFDRLDGTLEYDVDGHRQMTLMIDAASLDTGNPKRDTHLRAVDFFDCERHPSVCFRSTRVEDAGADRLRVEGDLEAAGRRMPLQLEATLTRLGDDELEIHVETAVNRFRFGMIKTRFGAHATTRLTVHAHLRVVTSPGH